MSSSPDTYPNSESLASIEELPLLRGDTPEQLVEVAKEIIDLFTQKGFMKVVITPLEPSKPFNAYCDYTELNTNQIRRDRIDINEFELELDKLEIIENPHVTIFGKQTLKPGKNRDLIARIQVFDENHQEDCDWDVPLEFDEQGAARFVITPVN